MDEESYNSMKAHIVSLLAMSDFTYVVECRNGALKEFKFYYEPDEQSVIFNGKKYGPISFWDAVDTISDACEIFYCIFNR